MTSSPLGRDSDQSERAEAFNLRLIASHTLLQVMAEEQAFYLLLSITPRRESGPARQPLNLCLVLDRSTSMQGARLQQVKEATWRLIDNLEPEDVLSLVTFSDRAEVLLPGQCDVDKAAAKARVSTLQASGGTEILQGLLAGLREIERSRLPDSVNYLALITDGHTYGDEPACLEQARQARAHQIIISPIGIGHDWNEEFLDELAALSGGTCRYVDAPHKIADAFNEAVRQLRGIIARELKITVAPTAGVRVHELFQVAPYIQRLPLVDHDTVQAWLGPLSAGQSKVLLLELRLQVTEAGQRLLADIRITGELPGQPQRQHEAKLAVSADFAAVGQSELEIPPAIVAALSRLTAYKLQEKALRDVQAGDLGAATQRLEAMATRLLSLGETELARSALLEAGQLARSGALSAEGRKKLRYGTRGLSTLLQGELQ